MKKILLIFSLFALLASCDKPFEMDLPLSVDQRNISLTKDAGSTHVLVYADGDWTATFTEPISWASLNKVSGSGNSDLVFTYSANYGINRKVGIVLQKDNLRDTVWMNQTGTISQPIYNPEVSQVPLLKYAGKATVFASGNVYYCADAIYATAIYPKEDGSEEEVLIDGNDSDPAHWITSFEALYDRFSFGTAANATGAERTAKVKVTINNLGGLTFNKYITVTQGNSEAEIQLAKTTEYFEAVGGEQVVALTKNNVWPYMSALTVSAPNGEWIKDIRLSHEGLVFNLEKNTTNKLRSCTMELTVSLLGGDPVKVSLKVYQKSN